MSLFAVQLGAVAGWLGFVGVVAGLIVVPTAIAGQPPTSSTELSSVGAYFSHPEIAIILGFVNGFIGVAVIPFGLGLRAAIRSGVHDRDRAFADVGLGLLFVAGAVYLVAGALGAALVDVSTRSGGELATVFRVYDVLYNGLADVLEGGWIGAFSLAMLGGTLPRWIGWLGVIVGLSRWVKALAPFVVLPDALALVSGLLFVAWFLATVVALTRFALRAASARPPSTAAA